MLMCVGLYLAWSLAFPPPKRAPNAQQELLADGGAALALATQDGGSLVAGLPVAPGAGAVVGEAPAAPEPAAPEEKVSFDSANRTFVFSSHGGALSSALLKGSQFMRRAEGDQPERPVDLVSVRRAADPLHPTLDPLPGTIELGGRLPLLPAGQPFTVEKGAEGVTFRTRVGDLAITKRWSVPAEGYDLALEVTLENVGAQPLDGALSTLLDIHVPTGKEKGGGFFSSGPVEAQLPIARIADKVERRTDDKSDGPQKLNGAFGFVGIDERYFLAALYPVQPDGTVEAELSAQKDGFRYARVSSPVAALAPGGKHIVKYGLYLGPKLQERLLEAGRSLPELSAAKPGLEKAVDYGFVEVISTLLLKVMRLFHELIPNWGVAIILLTLSVKTVLYPVTLRQMRSMEAMRALQPKIEALRKEFAGDDQRVSLETMKLYQQAGVNPLGGCLPMLLQMPIWWGLYRTLEYAFDLYRQPLIPQWISDLSAHDPIYLLPILVGASMYITQKMTPASGMDPAQQKVMQVFMPGFFTFVMLNLPSGLNLYIFVNNLLSIAQQLLIRRQMERAPQQPAAT